MNKYLFKTNATMKEYNHKKWWIDSNIIGEIFVVANNVTEALRKYKENVTEKYCVTISDNALKNKSPMYVDTKLGETRQVGYVITGKTDFQDNYGRWTSQFIDLWVNILTVVDTEFE